MSTRRCMIASRASIPRQRITAPVLLLSGDKSPIALGPTKTFELLAGYGQAPTCCSWNAAPARLRSSGDLWPSGLQLLRHPLRHELDHRSVRCTALGTVLP